MLGEILPTLDEHTTLIVLSDHGFAPYRQSFNLNTWLRDNGYIVMKSDSAPAPDDNTPFVGVDWSKTRAYGMGLNGLYLNVRGREREGMVDPGAQADALLREIRHKLVAVRDPKDDAPVITRVRSRE